MDRPEPTTEAGRAVESFLRRKFERLAGRLEERSPLIGRMARKEFGVAPPPSFMTELPKEKEGR